ncbi:MAG: helix-turn-helix domain-containing protein [Rhodobacteraceae bacterium]|nr:helix-turn-helix domain-containing protein [Paracoccaceae bacterium]
MTKTNWKKSEIKYRLARAGWPYMQDVDRRFGLPINTTANATHRPEPRGERVIADLLQVPAHVIWPSRYDATGNSTSLNLLPVIHQLRCAVTVKN